jgi:hypothetical protein
MIPWADGLRRQVEHRLGIPMRSGSTMKP